MKNILIVDDEKLIRELLAATLTNAGHEVFTAENGINALRVLELLDIDLIITDILMPDMDGIELIRAVKRNKESAVKIIAMSGSGLFDPGSHLEMARKLGADVVLEKPFTTKELLEVVQRTDLRVCTVKT